MHFHATSPHSSWFFGLKKPPFTSSSSLTPIFPSEKKEKFERNCIGHWSEKKRTNLNFSVQYFCIQFVFLYGSPFFSTTLPFTAVTKTGLFWILWIHLDTYICFSRSLSLDPTPLSIRCYGPTSNCSAPSPRIGKVSLSSSSFPWESTVCPNTLGATIQFTPRSSSMNHGRSFWKWQSREKPRSAK